MFFLRLFHRRKYFRFSAVFMEGMVKVNKTDVRKNIESKLSRYFGVSAHEATDEQMYKACAMTVKDLLAQKRNDYKKTVNKQGGKRVYYMCMEFLLGRSLKNNLSNLGLVGEYTEALKELGFELCDLYEQEPDAGLGNGGLGRLAACFLDSLSSLDYPATGFSILYEYGLFKQKLVDGLQIELPDVWLPGGEVWLVPRTDRTFKVKFGGHIRESWDNGRCNIVYEDAEEVEAVANDMMISGADSEAVSLLRLWKAQDVVGFDMSLFTQGQYMKAVEKNTNAEAISKVLYPSDNHVEGKMLRLTQQYFLTSASCQSIIRDHMAVYGTLDNFADKVAIHINDTHPALCIPELMRIFLDDYYMSWDDAWNIVTKVISYTNHTVMPEALETWNEDLFKLRLPRIYMIICEINRRFCEQAWTSFPGNWDKISGMAIIAHNQIRMANLSVIGSHTVNGVSALHSEILKNSCFKDFYKMMPEKFTNVTNGIAHRRWLCYSNPALADLLDECIGPGYRHDPSKLADFKKYADNNTVLDSLHSIKRANKASFSNLLYKKTGVLIDPDSLYDVQIKRLHEYKRQLLNALRIISLYIDLKNDPDKDVQPRTFIFGAKAAPGYDMAKQIIKLICAISADIDKNPKIAEKLKVVFVENYCVSLAESLIPASEISEQISLAGKEASGTGNMKFMINGAITVGTLDGANVEMLEECGNDNMFIFGLTTEEVNDMWTRGYNAASYYHSDERLARVIDTLNAGYNGESFKNMYDYLLTNSRGIADPFMCLADFESYMMAHDNAAKAYMDKDRWNRMSLMNIASAGKFAADRSIEEYANNIWHLKKITSK